MLKRNKRGQATVEYILLIVVIASLVAGLASFNGRIEQQFKSAKLGLRDKLAGNNELTRGDFFSGKIKVNPQAGGAGGTQAQGGGAGGGGGGGGAGGAGGGKKAATAAGGEAGKGFGGGGRGEEAAQTQTQEPNALSGHHRLEQEQEEIDRSNQAAQEYRQQQQTEEEAYKEKEKEAISERQLALASADERARLLKRAQEEGITTEKQQAQTDRNWNIGKFIIIIMVLLFVFVIILKSRQSRD